MAATSPPILSLYPKQPLPPPPPTSALCFRKSHRSSLLFAVPPRLRTSAAATESFVLAEADAMDTSQQLVSSTDGGVSNVISALLFVAFIGLSILTIGVIYIAVTDFLQKREREKFEKEEAAKRKSGKKGKVRARGRGGPRGFGQKLEDDDYDDE